MGMSISLKKDTRKTNIKHNNRALNEKEMKENSHVDFSRSHENKYLVEDSLKELYDKEFGKAQADYNDKQKRVDRKIKSYYDHIQGGKKTSLQQEMIVQVGDKDDFKHNPSNVNMANEVLENWFHDFEKRNPNLKIYNAVIHNDEASPHMHLNFVPVATGYTRGMDKQVSFDKAIIQQDKTLDKVRPFDDWRNQEVLLLEKKLNERGIERELVGTNDYEDVNDLKVKKDLEREIKELSRIVPKEKMAVPFSKKEIETKVIPKFIGKPDIVEKETENYVLTPDQYKSMGEQLHAAVAIKKDYERLKSSVPVKENEKLAEEKEELRLDHNRLVRKYNKKHEDYDELSKENVTLKGRVVDLTLEIKATYQSVKEFVREHATSPVTFKSAFKKVVYKVKEKTLQARERGGMEPERTEFEKTHRKEIQREQDNELSR